MPILTRLSSRRASEETEPPAYSELYSRDDSVMDRIVVSWIVNIICFSHKVKQIRAFPKHRKNCECCPGHYLSTSVYKCLLVSISVY